MPPYSLGSVSRASTPSRALSTRKAGEPREVDIKNGPSARELPSHDFDLVGFIPEFLT